MQMIVATCQGAFEPFKSFVMKTLKRDSSQTANEATSINKSETVFRPLRSYFKNTIELSHEAAVTIQKVV